MVGHLPDLGLHREVGRLATRQFRQQQEREELLVLPSAGDRAHVGKLPGPLVEEGDGPGGNNGSGGQPRDDKDNTNNTAGLADARGPSDERPAEPATVIESVLLLDSPRS